MRAFVRACVVKPLSAEDFGRLCWNILVPAQIRANLAAREIDDDDVLRTLELPVLVTLSGGLGRAAGDGRARARRLPGRRASWYEGVGHAPHLEESERFNRELADLTRRVRA
jgi:pimeloyl-ACP methyl ester carboxylesterase